ncbi:MAG: hypothetical protein NXI31_24855 [bacterium]|nr:hypothetical protein [bacterium]
MRIHTTFVVLALASAATAQWVQANPANQPSARMEPQMALHQSGDYTLLFGGADVGGFPPTTFGDTWAWDGTDWSQLSPAVSPPGRYFGGMVYDQLRDRTVLYGGLVATFFGANYLDDTWEWDGANWSQVTTTNTPGGLVGNPGLGEVSMAYDVIGGATVLFGGELFQGIVPMPAVTLEYDGTNWTQTAPAVSPPRRSQASMCSAPLLGGVLLFGGTNFNNPPGPNGEIVWNDLWVYSAQNDTWTQLNPTGPLPPARAGASLRFDAAAQVYVMHGGYDSTPTGTTPLSDTWIFDGTSWTDVTATYGAPTAPRVRFATADAPGGCDVYFGGGSAFFGPFTDETWIQGCSAESSTYGAGCPGSNGTPALAPSNEPVLGTNFALDASNLDPAATLAFMSIGFSNTTSSLGPLPAALAPFGLGATCDLWTSADATQLFAVSGGTGTYQFGVPTGAGFLGFEVFFQAASIDAGATGGIAVSNGVGGTFGY